MIQNNTSKTVEQKQALSIVAAKALPGLMTESLTYNAAKNVFLTKGWTSMAGNTYFRAVRGTNGIVIIFDLGQGYAYTFLNGITIVGFDGKQPRIIAKKQWGGCGNWIAFSELTAKRKCTMMLCDFLQSEAKQLGQAVSQGEAYRFAESLIEQTYSKRIA